MQKQVQIFFKHWICNYFILKMYTVFFLNMEYAPYIRSNNRQCSITRITNLRIYIFMSSMHSHITHIKFSYRKQTRKSSFHMLQKMCVFFATYSLPIHSNLDNSTQNIYKRQVLSIFHSIFLLIWVK